MILSNILFSQKDICREQDMYFKGFNYSIQNEHIIFKKNGLLSTSTYFNSFSIDKWIKYTQIQNLTINLHLEGEFNIALYSMQIISDKIERKLISKHHYKSEEQDLISLNYDFDIKGILYFQLEALEENSIFYKGYYSTEIDEEKLNPIALAIGICTFKREKYVIDNIDRIKNKISDVNSPLYNKTTVFISDNGQTLPYDNIESDFVHVYKNKNLGGAGGFTRCLIESKKCQNIKHFSNFIFMDDDIVLDMAAIEKNYVFLSVLKKQYLKSVIGGAMFSIDEQYLQFENAAKWENIEFKFNRRNVDMRLDNNIILNEEIYDINYNAWCYCCVPFEIITDDNLPIPVFFHMDDVEYGLRNKLNIITLNGINVWHLYKKSLINPKNDYYDIRNKLIMLSAINPQGVAHMAWTYLASFTNEVLKYHYARAINAYNGIIDFCKGFDYFKTLDTLEQHNKLFSNVKWVAATDEIKSKAVVGIRDNKINRDLKIKSMIKTIMPSCKKNKVFYDDNSITDVLGAKTVTIYNTIEDMSIEYRKSIKLAIKCFIKHQQIKKLIRDKLDNVVIDYNNRLREVQHINFWNKYLNLEENKKMKVLFAASDNDSTSGAFRSMVTLNKILMRDYNIETIVLLPKKGDGEKLLKDNNIRYTIIETEDWIIRLDIDETEKIKKYEEINKKNTMALNYITNILINEKIDLVHINTTYHYVTALAAYKLNIPVVWHIREFLEEDQERTMINKNKAYKLISNSDRIIAISDSISKKYENLLNKNKLTTVYNGIDLESFYNKDKVIFKEKNKLTFIIVGFIVPYKGQHYLLEACGKLKKECKYDLEILLVGSNTDVYMKKIYEVINEYDLKDNVKILGRRADTNILYQNSDIAFICSRSEAFGRVTIEAMMSGCLVIGANTAGTKELIEDKVDGLLYEYRNSDDLYNKILYAIKNKSLMKKIANNGRNKAINKYTAKLNADNIYSIYNQVLGANE